MMLSKPIASGAMLVLLIGAAGGAVLQGGGVPEAGIAEVSETAESEPAQPAVAPDRVVESAGFPIVSQAERDKANDRPIVTVNGRPLDSAPAAAATETVPEIESEPVTPAPAVVEDAVPPEETQIAVIEPPLPRPRPESLAVRSVETGLDYDAIADAAYGGRDSEFMTPQQRQTLESMPGVAGFEPNGGYAPRQDELVGVVGPNGEVIWVYEEQVPTMNSRVTIQRQQTVNPFGFLYD